MGYSVKEMFYTLQGEGANAGRASVFCRFAGCNLWSGREEDRSEAICQFCDTDFFGVDGEGGGRFVKAIDLAKAVHSFWPKDSKEKPFVVCTGGEPLLQLDQFLVDAFHEEGIEVAVETNGTLAVPEGIDWVCVSPKAGALFVARKGDELKLVFPQLGGEPEKYEHLEFGRFYLQPMDGASLEQNTKDALAYCMNNPQWRFSLQMHKVVGIS